MPLVLRWGRSAYETDADLALERAAAADLGLGWASRPEPDPPPELDRAEVLVVNSGVRVDAGVLSRFGGSLVLTTTSGTDHLDLDAARARGLTVARCPLARRDAVVQTALAGLLGLCREIPRLHDASRSGRWARGSLPTLAPPRLGDAPVAVLGAGGVIGSEMCRRLAALGVEVLGVDPRGAPDPVPTLALADALPRAGALTVHCDLNPTSAGLVDAAALDLLPPGAVVVNTARGPILDVEAAVERVRAGRLRGLLADVFPEEPWPALAAGARVPGVWFLPHAAGYAPDLGRRVAREVARALAAWSAGDPVPNAILEP